ncbi:MAG: two-component system sensor histidine kinase NtrB [Terriglobales bacterium]
MGTLWRPLRICVQVLAAAAISLAATAIILLIKPDRYVTLLVFLPGIAIVEALFGVAGGIAAVLLSVAGSAYIRMQFLRNPMGAPAGFYATWKEEMVLLLVGFFVVALMEMRRRSGERAASGAHQMAALLKYVADAVVIFDRHLRVVSLNPAAVAMLDRPGESVIGRSVDQLRQCFGFEPESGIEPPLFEEVLRSGVARQEPGTIVDFAHNRRIEVLTSVAPLRNGQGEIDGALVMLTDVTRLRALQTRTLDDARHRAVSQMASGLTHDFNHVLDIVRRAVAVLDLQDDASPEDRRKYRRMIDSATLDGSALVRQLRNYLADGAGPAAAVDLRDIAHGAVELTRPIWRDQPGLEVIEDLHPVPPVQGNANDLRRLLTNLIFNAVEALAPLPAAGGRITVHTEATQPAAGQPGAVVAWIEDTGSGIAPERQIRIFTPYFTTKPQGLGMGLFGAQKIALAHGGSLRFTSSARGTRFTLSLPLPAESVLSRSDAA